LARFRLYASKRSASAGDRAASDSQCLSRVFLQAFDKASADNQSTWRDIGAVGAEMDSHKQSKNEHKCEDILPEFMAHMPRRANIATDQKIDSIIALLPTLPIEGATQKFASLIDSENLGSIFSSLRATEKTASPQAAETLARVVAMTSSSLPREENEDVAAAFTQAPVFVAEMLRRIGDELTRDKLASIIISESPSLPFVCDVMQWVAGSMTRPPVFTAETEMRLQHQLAGRIDQYFSSEATPIYLRDRENTNTYLWVLLKAGRSDKIRTYLTDALTSRPESICEFLWAIFPNRGPDLRTGEMRLIRIFPQQYDFLLSLVDPAFVADLAQTRIKGLPDSTGSPNSESEWDAAHLKQFLAFYHSA
jgi:hypothetical protein